MTIVTSAVDLTAPPARSAADASLPVRFGVFAYGLVCYVAFLGVFLYAMGFIMNFGVPLSLDTLPGRVFIPSILINLALLAMFAIQHSVMARPSFKRLWTLFVPAPMERSTYVLFSSLALVSLFVLWQPMGGVIWSAQSELARVILLALGGLGWLIVLLATFLINHFDLFGLRQVWLFARGRDYFPLRFQTPMLYRFVRHPLYVGWLMAFWFTPTMTVAHLVFAATTTAYILVAIQFEERNLIQEHGENYRAYRRRVPMLVPFIKHRSPGSRRAD